MANYVTSGMNRAAAPQAKPVVTTSKAPVARPAKQPPPMDAFDARPSAPRLRAARLGQDGVVPLGRPQQAAVDPGTRLATARQKLDQAVADLESAKPDELKAKVAAFKAAATEYQQALQDAYGVTITETLSKDRAATKVDTVNMNLASVSTLNKGSALESVKLIQGALDGYGDGLDQMSTWLAKVKGSDPVDKYALFQKVMGPVTINLTDTPPTDAKDAKGYTKAPVIYDSLLLSYGTEKLSYKNAMPAPNLVHELMHVLMSRAGKGNADNSALVAKLGEPGALKAAEDLMIHKDNEKLRQDKKDLNSKTEAAADLMLYFAEGQLDEGDYKAVIDEMLNAAMNTPA